MVITRIVFEDNKVWVYGDQDSLIYQGKVATDVKESKDGVSKRTITTVEGADSE